MAADLTWGNVGIGLLFILFDSLLSVVFRLSIASSLLVSALRCVLQLTVMSMILGRVFEAENVWAVAGMVVMLNVLSATEATYNKAKRRFTNMVGRLLAVRSGLPLTTTPSSR